MKASNYILIGMLSLCLVSQGATFFEVCLGPGHPDSGVVEWARDCHVPAKTLAADGTPRKYAFDHAPHDCFDVSMVSVAGFGGHFRPVDQSRFTRPVFLNPVAWDHLCRPHLISRQQANRHFFFTYTVNLSSPSTVLII